MKKYKIVYEAVLPIQHPHPYDKECSLVNEQIKEGWNVENSFLFSDSRIAFVLVKISDSDFD